MKVFLNKHQSAFTRTITQLGHEDNDESSVGAIEDNFAAILRQSPHLNASFLRKRPKPLIWKSEPAEPGDKLTYYREGYLPISRLYRNVTTSSGTQRLSDQELDSAFARGLQTQWTEYYADISKEITQIQQRGLAEILGFFLSGQVNESESIEAPDADVAFERIKGFLGRQAEYSHLIPSRKQFSAIYKQRRELQNVVKQIETVEQKVNTVNAPRERFRSVLESMFSGDKRLIFTEKEIEVELPDSRHLGLSLLSSGEKQLLFIAFHALTGGNSSLIIDEPELSMHVDWQKLLVATLVNLNPRLQLIVATHSPEIMADIPDSKIFSL